MYDRASILSLEAAQWHDETGKSMSLRSIRSLKRGIIDAYWCDQWYLDDRMHHLINSWPQNVKCNTWIKVNGPFSTASTINHVQRNPYEFSSDHKLRHIWSLTSWNDNLGEKSTEESICMFIRSTLGHFWGHNHLETTSPSHFHQIDCQGSNLLRPNTVS